LDRGPKRLGPSLPKYVAPQTKRTMLNLALSYERLAKHAALREAREGTERIAPPERDQGQAA